MSNENIIREHINDFRIYFADRWKRSLGVVDWVGVVRNAKRIYSWDEKATEMIVSVNRKMRMGCVKHVICNKKVKRSDGW